MANYLWKENLLTGDADTFYFKTDSHTSFLGGYYAALAILSALDVRPKVFCPRWRDEFFSGGDLAENEVTEGPLKYIANLPEIDIVFNGINNRGAVKIFKNPSAIDHRMIIFGDSFSSMMFAHNLSIFIKEVIFIHSAGSDDALISNLNPDTIVFQIAERFLIQPPIESQSVAKIINDKLSANALSPEEYKSFFDTFEQFEHIYGHDKSLLRSDTYFQQP